VCPCLVGTRSSDARAAVSGGRDERDAVDTLQALAAPRRREMLRLLRSRELSAGELRLAMSDITFGAVSQHLRALRDARVVSVRVAGRHRYYRARKTELGPLVSWLESSWDDADAYACVSGADELAAHIAAARRFMPLTLERAGEPRQCQGRALCDFTAAAGGVVRARGTNSFELAPGGRIRAVCGFWGASPQRAPES